MFLYHKINERLVKKCRTTISLDKLLNKKMKVELVVIVVPLAFLSLAGPTCAQKLRIFYDNWDDDKNLKRKDISKNEIN